MTAVQPVASKFAANYLLSMVAVVAVDEVAQKELDVVKSVSYELPGESDSFEGDKEEVVEAMTYYWSCNNEIFTIVYISKLSKCTQLIVSKLS